MVGPKDIRPVRHSGVKAPTLNEREKAEVQQKQSQALKGKDAARLAQQAGFQRVADRKKGKQIFGDSSQAPIPLPDDELDSEAWTQQGLESAEQALCSADVQLEQVLKEVRAGAEGRTLGTSFLESGFMPVEEDLEKLEALTKREAPLNEEGHHMLRAMGESLENLFGIELGEQTSLMHQVMAAGLVVAGESDGVQPNESGLDEEKLASGVQAITNKSNKAVQKAKSMNQGIGKELSVHRTMVFKR